MLAPKAASAAQKPNRLIIRMSPRGTAVRAEYRWNRTGSIDLPQPGGHGRRSETACRTSTAPRAGQSILAVAVLVSWTPPDFSAGAGLRGVIHRQAPIEIGAAHVHQFLGAVLEEM